MPATFNAFPPKSLPVWMRPSVVAALVLAFCLALTWHTWRDSQREAEQALQQNFDYRAREVVNALDQRMSGYMLVMRGVQGLFASSREVSRAEFADYVMAHDIEHDFPGIRAIGYSELASPAGRDALTARIRAEGYPEFRIAPPGERAQYAPVVFVEPFSGSNLRAFGYDALGEPVRRAVYEMARDTGLASISGKITLVQENGASPQAGFLLALPIYRNGALRRTPEERRAALAGWIYAAFRAGELIAGLPVEQVADLNIEMFDGASTGAAAHMAGASEKRQPVMQQARQLRIGGHTWTLVVGALPSYTERLQVGRPHFLLGAGLLTSVLMTALFWLLARSNVKARAALDQSRTLARELASGQERLAGAAETAQRAEAMMKSILDSTIDGILVDNGEHRILASNQRFRELWSIPEGAGTALDEQQMLSHLLSQLLHPAPFLYIRSQEFAENEEQRDLLRLKDGRYFEQYTRAIRLGNDIARLWSFRDVTERKQVEQRERSHRHVLEMLAGGAPLPSILDAIALGVEATNPGMLCTIHLLADEGRRMLTGATPSLPESFAHMVAMGPVDAQAGAVAATAATGLRTVAANILFDPGWRNLRDDAVQAGVAASCAEPIRGGSGKLLGVFTIYHREPCQPSAANLVLIEHSAALAGIAIEQAQSAQALRVGEERFRSLYANAPVALWEQDWSGVREAYTLLAADGVEDLAGWLRERPDEAERFARLVRMLDANGAALAQVGAAPDQDIAQLGLAQNFSPAARAAFIDAVVALAGGAALFACEASFERIDGVLRQNEVTLLVMPGHTDTLDFVIVSTVDITERKRMDAELLTLATTDFLTGLPNRREFMARMEAELERVRRAVSGAAAVLVLDIDHFKTVNDNHGHATGDIVLRHMAALMRECQRKIDVLGRIGGEEFAILLPGANAEAAYSYAERLRKAVANNALVVDGLAIPVTISIGVAGLLGGDLTVDAALARADKALYRAKQGGRNRVEMQEDAAVS